MELITQSKLKKCWVPSLIRLSMKDIIAALDAGILKIQSTSSVIRELRPLKDMAFWKANENMLYNTHLLTHITEGVFNFGPIWGHNSFLYKSKNRHILMLSKSPHLLCSQIARKFLTFQSLTSLLSKMIPCSKVRSFSSSVLEYKKLMKVNRVAGCVLLGKPKCQFLSSEDREKLSLVCETLPDDHCFLYQRMYFFDKKRYTTAAYGDKKKIMIQMSFFLVIIVFKSLTL
ncbi:Thioredoxin domain-containing protein C13F5.05, mitochondrial [Frankliniella fusca]|uniref:Thioredoxin domain-containing protein C13F5.05, mitochondrial n=1 Tax=Frankliniella fusca TaxID=407009 RepID=A0AAE1HAC7_9NEOP|nr:Thioredoxin domain-containing protein C13F5.05, mitochondrial [Frankliniella fusca]